MEDIRKRLDIESLLSHTEGDSSVTIAVLDGGVDIAHPVFRGANLQQIGLDAGPPRLPSTHGTHIASLLFGQQYRGIRGIAPGCRGVIIPIFDVEDDRVTTCSQKALAKAIDKAVDEGANVINISAGEMSTEVDKNLRRAIERCEDEGVLVVAAAGDRPRDHGIHLPAALSSVLAVGTLNDVGSDADYAGQKNLILAPGNDVIGALPDSQIGYMNGSSCATALVSGVAALLLSLQAQYGATPDVGLVRNALLFPGSTGHADPQTAVLNVGQAFSDVMRAIGQLTASGVDRTGFMLDAPLPKTDWSLVPEVCRKRYGLEDVDRFGTTQVVTPDGMSYRVADLQYDVGPHERGMCLLPVRDTVPIFRVNGDIVGGSEVVDQWLRERVGLRPEDPIFALLSYVVPYDNIVGLHDLPKCKLKLGHQHLAAYIGSGKTTHALPPDTDWKGMSLLDMDWNVDRYPANMQMISLYGTPQATVNRNAVLVDTMLMATVQAPEDPYTIDCKFVSLRDMLQFYRDTLLEAEYLKLPEWSTNCAVQKTIVVNIALNLPHNEAAFRRHFGRTEGMAAWKAFIARYEQIYGSPFLATDETYFQPLWVLSETALADVQPMSLAEVDGTSGECPSSAMQMPRSSGVNDAALAWPLETAADVLKAMLETYVDTNVVGATGVCALLIHFRHVVKRFVGLEEADYLNFIAPTLAEILTALRSDPAVVLYETIERDLDEVLQLNAEFDRGSEFQALSDASCELRQAVLSAVKPTRTGEGAPKFVTDVVHDALRHVQLAVASHDDTHRFATPSVVHQIATGLHPCSNYVRVRTVGTVLDASELFETEVGRFSAIASDQIEEGEFQSSYMTEEELIMTIENSRTKGEPAGVRPSQSLEEERRAVVEGKASIPLVYALGRIGYRFVSSSRRNSFKQHMGGDDPGEPEALLSYLNNNPFEAVNMQWTLELDGTPIYVIQPDGPFARDVYECLRQFLHDQVTAGAERVSIPGYVVGMAPIGSGLEVGVLVPELRGMSNWTTEVLVDSVCGPSPPGGEEKRAYDAKASGVSDFLERVYYELKNLGQAPRDRALNYAATNAFQVEKVFERALSEEMELETIQVEESPVAPMGSDYWDVKLVFFFPHRDKPSPRKVFRFTVDVSDTTPVTVGPMRTWWMP